MATTNIPRPGTFAPDPPLAGLTFGGRLTGWQTDPIVQVAAYIVVVSLVFIVLPGIDVWFSGLFAAVGGGFPVAGVPAFEILRDLNRGLTWVIPVFLVILIVVKLVRPDIRSLVAPSHTVFLLATLAVGSGIIANLIFKDHWGRPRPINVDLFGGALPFVRAWLVSNACPANCSFVSGEASSAIWLLGLVVLMPLAWRAAAFKWIAAFAVIVSLNRIAFGGHFLSDVMLAWGFTALTMVVGYRYLVERPIPWLSNNAQEQRWTDLGVWIRRRLGFPTPAIVSHGSAAAAGDFYLDPERATARAAGPLPETATESEAPSEPPPVPPPPKADAAVAAPPPPESEDTGSDRAPSSS